MKHLSFFLILISLLTSCSNKSDDIDAADCPKDIACTEVFMSVVLKIKDQQGKPYALDEYYTTKVSTGATIKVSGDINIQRELGAYPVMNDNNIESTTKAGEEFEFKGIKEGKVVITRQFTIGHDCCHVKLKEGETDAVIAD